MWEIEEMDVEWIRKYCRTLPHTTESVQWGDHLVFKVGGKIYTIASLEPGGNFMSFKCSPEDFADLTERPEIVPAPYLARAQWVALETPDALTAVEIKAYLRRSYDLVWAKLPKKAQATLCAKTRHTGAKVRSTGSAR